MNARARNQDAADDGRPDLAELGARLRKLADLAEAAGADLTWLERTLAALLGALLELEELRAGYRGTGRHVLLQRDRRMAKARAAGADIEDCREISGLSRSQVYRRLQVVAPTMRQPRGITRRRPERRKGDDWK